MTPKTSLLFSDTESLFTCVSRNSSKSATMRNLRMSKSSLITNPLSFPHIANLKVGPLSLAQWSHQTFFLLSRWPSLKHHHCPSLWNIGLRKLWFETSPLTLSSGPSSFHHIDVSVHLFKIWSLETKIQMSSRFLMVVKVTPAAVPIDHFTAV